MSNSRPSSFYEKALISAPIVIGLIAISGFMIDPVYGVWVDRDLLRASQIFEIFPVMGAELNGTYYARTPGGAYYYILGLLTAVSSDPVVLTRVLIVLSVSGGLAVYYAATRLWGTIAGLVAAGMWLTSPLVLGAGFQIINPAVGVPISGFCYLMFVRYFQGERNALFWLAILLGIVIQSHISFLALAVTFAIGIVLFCRPRLLDGLAAVVTFVLTFTPYILVEMMNGFANTRLLILGRDEPNPIYTSVKLGSLDFFFSSVTKPLFQSQTAALVGGAVIFVVISFMIFKAFGRVIISKFGAKAELKPDRTVLGLAGVLLVGIVLLAWGRGFATQSRYFVFLVPAIAILVGGVTASVLNWTHNAQPLMAKWSVIGVALVLIVLSSGHVRVSVETYKNTAISQTRVAQLVSLVRAVKTYTGYNREEINERVVVVGADGKFQEEYASYLAGVVKAPVKESVTAKPSCLAVVRTADVTQSERAFKTFMAGMPFSPVISALLGRDRTHSLFAYSLENGNCYKSLGNSYDHFAEERFARDRCDQAEHDGTVWTEQNARGVRAVIRDTFDKVRLCFRVDMELIDGRLDGTLYSWQGRSYSGYPIGHWSFWNLNLQFSQNGKTASRPLTLTPLGQFKFGRMPWKFSIEPPTDGVYDLVVDYSMEYQKTADFTVEVHDASAPVHKARHQVAESFVVTGVSAN
jgi:hypothetical protein